MSRYSLAACALAEIHSSYVSVPPARPGSEYLRLNRTTLPDDAFHSCDEPFTSFSCHIRAVRIRLRELAKLHQFVLRLPNVCASAAHKVARGVPYSPRDAAGRQLHALDSWRYSFLEQSQGVHTHFSSVHSLAHCSEQYTLPSCSHRCSADISQVHFVHSHSI